MKSYEYIDVNIESNRIRGDVQTPSFQNLPLKLIAGFSI